MALSGGDVSLTTATTRFAPMKRGVRRLLLRLLDRAPNAVEDVMRHAERWKRLAEVLHPGDYADKYPRALAAITAARRNDAPASFGSRVETLLAQRHIAALTPLLQQRPGEFARRLDVTLRRSTEPGAVLDAFETVAAQASTPILLQVLAQAGAAPLPLRAFTPKGALAKVYGIQDRREPLAPEVLARAARICQDALVKRFASLPPLGRCFVDPALRDYIVPLAQRAASKSLRTLVRGSRLPLPDTRFIRLFLWWKNGRARTDIDLSAAFFDANFVFMQTVAYYNLKGFGGYHSGDIVDAPQGASEFIDLDIDALVEKGIRYVVTSINSYTRQPYCDLPECFAGWMARADLASGEVYEPRTVVDRIDIASDTQICLPFVMDLQERRVIWADLGLTSTPRWNNVRNNLSGVSLMLRALVHTPRPDLETLFDLHVRARGTGGNAAAGRDRICASPGDYAVRCGRDSVTVSLTREYSINPACAPSGSMDKNCTRTGGRHLCPRLMSIAAPHCPSRKPGTPPSLGTPGTRPATWPGGARAIRHALSRPSTDALPGACHATAESPRAANARTHHSGQQKWNQRPGVNSPVRECLAD